MLSKVLNHNCFFSSRDWNAGKRSFGDTNPNECSALWRTIATLCTAISVIKAKMLFLFP